MIFYKSLRVEPFTPEEEHERMSRRQTESGRSDKTDGGESKLICFFDENGTPRNSILNINKTLLTSLLSPPSQYTSPLLSLPIPISSNLSSCPFHTLFFFFKTSHTDSCPLSPSLFLGGGGVWSIFSFNLFPFLQSPSEPPPCLRIHLSYVTFYRGFILFSTFLSFHIPLHLSLFLPWLFIFYPLLPVFTA